MKFRHFFLISMLLIIMAGCVPKYQVVENEKISSHSKRNLEYLSQKPPQMKIEINDEKILAVLSGYEWSFFDEEENRTATVQAESISPSELLDNRRAPSVNSKTSIQFEFDREPHSYKVTIWEAKKFLNSSSDVVVLDGERGRTIYEVTATWEQGTAHYFFPLTIE